MAVVLLASLELLGCHGQVIDALQAPDESDDASSAEAAVGDAQLPPEGAADGGLVAYYSFNSAADPVHDYSGNGRDGTLVGATWTDAGQFGGAIQFSAAPDGGVDDWIDVNPFPQPQTLTGDWSVSFWLLIPKSEDFSANYVSVLSTEMAMMGGWEVDILPPYPSVPTYASLQFGFWVTSSGAYSTASCTCLEFGTWTHFVAVVDGSALTIQLFQNSVADGNAQKALGPFATGLNHLFMGRWGGSTSRQLQGVLDEVAIFDRVLSTAQVKQLYAGVVPGLP